MSEQKRPGGAGQKRPLTEEEKARRRKARRIREMKKRRRRRLVLLGVIGIVLIVLIVMGIRSIFGAVKTSLIPRSEVTTLTLKDDGTVIFEEVSALPEEYDASKVEAFAKDQVKAYSPAGEDYVKLEKVEVKDNQVYIRTSYSDIEVYEDFTGYEAFYGTVSRAKSAGYDFSTVFSEVKETEGSDGNLVAKTIPAARDDVLESGDKSVLIIRENVRVSVFGKLLYVSTEGVEVSPGMVDIASLDGNNDAPSLTYIIFDAEPKTETKGSK